MYSTLVLAMVWKTSVTTSSQETETETETQTPQRVVEGIIQGPVVNSENRKTRKIKENRRHGIFGLNRKDPIQWL